VWSATFSKDPPSRLIQQQENRGCNCSTLILTLEKHPSGKERRKGRKKEGEDMKRKNG
jgi:hypothetical protein